MLILYVLILVAALIGLSITVNIYKQKHEKKPLVCPFGADCHTVVTSQFSSFLGIGLELYGAAYYSLVILTYATFILFPGTVTPWSMFIATGATIGAFLFSLYLTFVQAFLIKSWCSWCLMSAGVSTSIFIFTMIELSVLNLSLLPILESLNTPILWMHLLGFALGVGGATITDIMFLKFLRDFTISKDEDAVLRTLSQVIWIGLLFVVISGIGLYLLNAETLHESSKFLLKMVVVAVIIINGAFLNLYVSPKLVTLSWNALPALKPVLRLRRAAFALGAISFVSWYSAFILGSIDSAPFTFTELLGIYGGLLLIAVVGSQILERMLCKSASTARV
ncbi:MAG: hypothetical protein RL150_550 [Candidatus Parcubacteria bacterium]|jgi:uncharacterized membrane protein